MPTLALCMIVKNEEEMLAGCLESVKGIVDEMIVVDTGSTDNTKQIAIDAGAKVFDFEWINDFSAARNFAKAQTDCDFILSLDADERLYLDDADAFRAELVDQKRFVGMISLTNGLKNFDEELVSDEFKSLKYVMVPRILANIPENYWTGRVHEVPILVLSTMSFASSAKIVHLGGDVEYRNAKGKGQRNLELLEMTLQEDPDQTPLFYSYLAIERRSVGDRQGFMEALKEGWEKFFQWYEDHGVQGLEYSMGSLPYYPLTLFFQGEIDCALTEMKRLLKILSEVSNPLNPLAVLVDGFLESDFGSRLSADILDLLYQCCDIMLQVRTETFLEPTVFEISHESLLSRKLQILCMKKDFESFDEVYEMAKECFPENLALSLWEIEALIEKGEFIQSFEKYFTFIDRFGYHEPDQWVLGAILLVGLNKESDAKQYLASAIARVQAGFVSGHRLRLLQSMLVRQDVLDGKPRVGAGVYGVLGAILARQPIQTSRLIPSSVIEQVVERYVDLGKVDLLLRFFDPRVQYILPGADVIVKNKLTALGFELVDDGEIAPVVLVGSSLDDIVDVLANNPDIDVLTFTKEEHLKLRELLESYQNQSIDDILMGAMSFLEEETVSDSLDSFFHVKVAEYKKKCLIIWDSTWPIELLSEVLISKQVIFYLGDPDGLNDELALFAWHENNIQIAQTTQGQLYFTNSGSIQRNPRLILEQMYAYIGMVPPEDGYQQFDDLLGIELPDWTSIYPSAEAQSILKQWGFIS